MEGDDGGAVHGLPTYPLPPGFIPGLSGSRPIQYPPGFCGPMSPMRVRSESRAAPCSPSSGVLISDNRSDTPYCSPSELSPIAPPFFPPNQSAKLQVTPGSSTPSTAAAPCSVNCTSQMGYSRCVPCFLTLLPALALVIFAVFTGRGSWISRRTIEIGSWTMWLISATRGILVSSILLSGRALIG